MSTLDFVLENKVVSIVRRVYGDDLLKLAHALCDGGVKMIECTFDQQDPCCIEKTTEAISMLCAEFGDRMCFGAGTVLSAKQVDAAADAGAKYIISPNVNPYVIGRTKELGLVSIPGAMTPTEILSAHDLGADIVKLFPATTLGFKYIKDILAPITHVRLMATGGVTEENFADYLSLGFVGAGVSGRLSDMKLIAAGDFDTIRQRAAAFVRIAGEN